MTRQETQVRPFWPALLKKSQTCLGRGRLPRNPIRGMEKKTHAICVFCGSSFGRDPRFRDAARDVGVGIAKAGWSLVFGGGGNG